MCIMLYFIKIKLHHSRKSFKFLKDIYYQVKNFQNIIFQQYMKNFDGTTKSKGVEQTSEYLK